MNLEFFWMGKLLSKRKKTIGNLLLITFVVTPLVLCVVFVDSMINGITEKYIWLSGGQIQFTASSDFIPEDPRMSPVVSGYAVIYSSSSTADVMIKGVDENYFNAERLSQLGYKLEDKDGYELGAKASAMDNAYDSPPIPSIPSIPVLTENEVLMSAGLARSMGLDIGDKVAMMVLSNPDKSLKSSYPAVFRPVLLQVAGLFSSGYSQLDDSLMFGSSSYFSGVFKNDEIQIEMLTGTNDIEANMDIAYQIIGENSLITSFSLWNERNESVYQNFANSKQMILVIILVIGLMACIYCGTIAQEVAADNREEICIIRMIGGSELQARRTIFLTALLIVTAGVAMGLIAGLILSLNLPPILKSLASSGFPGFALYLLDFEVQISGGKLLLLAALIIGISSMALAVSLRSNEKYSPLELLQS
ncbi:MAG: ABC transporter permease [Sphaerochaetaceae bacterium]